MANFKSIGAVALIALSLSACQKVKEDGKAISTNNSACAETAGAYTFGRYVPERLDDFAWENDKVAFRIYGPNTDVNGAASGVDAWLKRVDYPIIDKWYREYKLRIKNYHTDTGEGYDPYHTGTSRGVGGTAIWVDGKAYPADHFQDYEVITNNGKEIRFKVDYEWETPLGLVAEAKTISMGLGTNLYSVESKFTLNGSPAKLPVAIGLTTHDGKAKAYQNKDKGWISAWEKIHNLGLGTGAIIDPTKVEEIKHVENKKSKDASHIWIITATDSEGNLAFKAGHGWEGRGEFSSAKAWNSYLDKQ